MKILYSFYKIIIVIGFDICIPLKRDGEISFRVLKELTLFFSELSNKENSGCNFRRWYEDLPLLNHSVMAVGLGIKLLVKIL